MDITISFPGGKKVDAQVGPHLVRTDQGEAGGGEGSAPEPFALFLASIGTCAGVFILGFCQTRDIPVEGLRLVQRHAYDTEAHRMTKISIEIQVPPDFPEKYIAALPRVAAQCAVKRAIADPPEFEITTAVKA